jgi:signal transduction histidine kinase/ActR/RegA family two-component response regulator
MILIVDDKPENIFSLQRILELNNFQTDTAVSGEEALKKTLKNNYALIILDVQMPGMDGFEVAEAITGLNKTRDIPIIFLSAVNTHKKFVTRGFESGAVDYITKPVDPDILILKVRNFYRLYEKTFALKEAEKALIATVNELHSTLESIPQIAFTASPSGTIEFVNRHWFHYSQHKDEFPLTHPDDIPANALWLQGVASGKPVEMEVRIKRMEDGQFRYHLVRAIPIIMGNKVMKWVGTLTDIHEQKSLNELLERKVAERTRELLEMNRELEISNNDLQQFASVASHDLKEPLRKIQMFSNIIKDREVLNERTVKYLDKILQSSERMSNLITDLLSFARLSEAEIFEMANINAVIDDILVDLELLIEEKSARVEVDKIPRLEVVPGLIRQLFQNIISNALKFSKPDVPPRITISAEYIDEPYLDHPKTELGNYCRISVSDNGIGFEEMFAGKIFTIFQRLNPREQYEGTGIGLAIAKKIVDKHNGSISARSKPGEGATFIIILPVRQPALPSGIAGKQVTATTSNT